MHTMKWAWKIASFSEIQIFVHATFVILPAVVLFETLAVGGTLGAALSAVFFVLAVFGCVLLHELGHALMAARYGIATRSITLLPIGGLALLERMPEKPRQELAVALAGPAVNVVIAASLFLGMQFAGGFQNLQSISMNSSSWTVKLMVANIVLVLFNLLPAFPMDGGRVVRALLAMHMPYRRATGIAASLGQTIAIFLGVVGFFTNWFLMLVAFFIYFAARAEALHVEFEYAPSELQNETVGPSPMRDISTPVNQPTIYSNPKNSVGL
jgi:Zn-dependent protease